MPRTPCYLQRLGAHSAKAVRRFVKIKLLTLKTLQLIVESRPRHVSRDTVREFESAILSSKNIVAVEHRFALLSRVFSKMFRSLPNINYPSIKGNGEYFVVLMGTELKKCFPYFLSAKSKSVYLFDAWPKNHRIIEAFLDRFDIANAFFSSCQVAEMFAKKMKCKCFWVPEGIDVKEYKYNEQTKRDIDVIQFGRKYNWYHEQIAPVLKKRNKVYLYAKKEGEIVFPTKNGFVDGLSRSKISICFPSSITHPEKSGDVSTLTARYLQSMAAKCLVVGIMPNEMRQIFGYDPVVEIDERNPGKHLLSILHEYERYLPLIEKNYRTIREEHTWSKRWEMIRDCLWV